MATFVTNGGLGLITNRLKGVGAAEPNYVAWGTGTGQTAASTTLATESAESRTAGTSSQQTTDTTNDTYQVIGTMTATASRAITEAGLFNASTSGTLFMYGDFSVINLAINDSIEFTFKVDFD